MSQFRRLLSRRELKAVYPEDLDGVLRETGLASLLQEEKLKCHRCGRSLTRDEIACVLRTEDGFVALCAEVGCYASASTGSGGPRG